MDLGSLINAGTSLYFYLTVFFHMCYLIGLNDSQVADYTCIEM